jgi:lipoprotein-anchoring transpeptidase ErfK/SrfK
VAGLLVGACIEQQAPPPVSSPPHNSPVETANANTNSNIEKPSPESSPNNVSQVQVTLPLVDALLQDDSFVNDAKTNLQIPDEQIEKLRDATRDDIVTLDEADSKGHGSTQIAVAKAEKKIKTILGDDKGSQFLDFVRARGADVNPQLTSAPNSVPTDTRIVVNSPAFRMDEFKNGSLVKSYKVGIGYPEFPLTTGLRKADVIIFNPTWTPPDSPWVRGKIEPLKKIDAGSKDNPLGILKIPIGYPSLIHGGKQPSRLGTFASHGCVGLTNDLVRQFALELADMSGTTLTPDQIKGYEKNRSVTRNVKLENAVPVELRYDSIVVQNGKLIIYRDVYDRGTNTESTLRRVLDAVGVPFDSFSATDRQKMLNAVKQMATGIGSHASDVKKASAVKEIVVTRSVPGTKKVVLEFPQLAGKGYPDPVNLAG